MFGRNTTRVGNQRHPISNRHHYIIRSIKPPVQGNLFADDLTLTCSGKNINTTATANKPEQTNNMVKKFRTLIFPPLNL